MSKRKYVEYIEELRMLDRCCSFATYGYERERFCYIINIVKGLYNFCKCCTDGGCRSLKKRKIMSCMK